jgi:release factor glutamine methyltransferase
VVGIDNSAEAIELAERNAAELGARNMTFRKADLFDNAAMAELGSFDLVISNPPYIAHEDVTGLQPEVRDHEPQMALTDFSDGYSFYDRFIELAPTMLRDGGNMFLEIGYGQSARLMESFARAGFTVDVLSDLDRIPRILWATK